ncbi:hypothetical protein E4U41_001776 [Claviceps citrina]|nr:hypothetical protein E4U41_001776 [Claviceps citrina]
MERARQAVFGRRGRRTPAAEEYEPLTGAEEGEEEEQEDAALQEPVPLVDSQDETPFSWIEYCIFGFLGVAMLWAWNMFLAAAPYFSARFASNAWIRTNFQSGILTVSTVTNLGVLVTLSNMQQSASYPLRIKLALLINSVTFALLTGSTALFLDASPAAYFAFLLGMVALSSWAMGLIQNGAFAFAASCGRPEYMQALMAGQGVAGVLPAVAQVTTVLLFPPHEPPPASSAAASASRDEPQQPGRRGETSAFLYFLAAVAISIAALAALVPLLRRHNRRVEARATDRTAASASTITTSISIEHAERAGRKAATTTTTTTTTSLWTLSHKLRWLAAGVATTFAVTMFFPVFTAKILSVHQGQGDGDGALSALFRPAAFIPLGFLFWNLGDLAGRVATMRPSPLQDRPPVLFLLAVARAALVPLYLLCNIRGRGAVVSSDLFYLFVVQLVFGLTNGWLGSSLMMASGRVVDEAERETAGALMGLFLVIGLTVGSLLSFTASGI